MLWVTGVELVVGYLIAWAVRKAKRVGARADQKVDQALDAGMDRLHELVAAKLADEPALRQLEAEAIESNDARERTRKRVQLALDEAVDTDTEFADALSAALQQVHGVVVGRDLNMHAEKGSVVFWHAGRVTINQEPPRPPAPGRT
jgi:hypothetical protein